MSLSASELRTLARTESDSLFGQLQTLSSTQMTVPTRCGEWDVLDLIAHIRMGNIIHTTMIENGLDGRIVPPFSVPEGTEPRPWFEKVHAEERARGAEAILAEYPEAIAQYDAALAKVDDAALERTAWFYTGPAPLRLVIGARLIDLILHAADIRRAVGIDPWFSPAGSAFCGSFGIGALQMFFVPNLANGLQGGIRFVIDEVETLARVTTDGVTLGSPDGSEQATVTTTGGTASLLTWNRLTLDEALEQGLATVDGDADLARSALRAVRAP